MSPHKYRNRQDMYYNLPSDHRPHLHNNLPSSLENTNMRLLQDHRCHFHSIPGIDCSQGSRTSHPIKTGNRMDQARIHSPLSRCHRILDCRWPHNIRRNMSHSSLLLLRKLHPTQGNNRLARRRIRIQSHPYRYNRGWRCPHSMLQHNPRNLLGRHRRTPPCRKNHFHNRILRNPRDSCRYPLPDHRPHRHSSSHNPRWPCLHRLHPNPENNRGDPGRKHIPLQPESRSPGPHGRYSSLHHKNHIPSQSPRKAHPNRLRNRRDSSHRHRLKALRLRIPE
jgi:hypothetical protein